MCIYSYYIRLRTIKQKHVHPLYTIESLMCTVANFEDPDEMPHKAAFHQGLHCLLRQNRVSVKEMQFYMEIIKFDFSIYSLDHPKFTVSNRGETPLVYTN